ncbi:MAG: heme exporter protein CcmD [Gammaproteobacteria bacterium]|nr:heme exporter protein CcmD [Gammaproteobacteria bacterium]
MNEYFSMGGYAFYVWTSYGMTLLVLLLIFFWPVVQRRKLTTHLKRNQLRQAQLARRQA